MHYLACCYTPQLPAAPKRIKTRVARHDACESFMQVQCESCGKYFVCFETGTKTGLSECVRREVSCSLKPTPWGTAFRERRALTPIVKELLSHYVTRR